MLLNKRPVVYTNIIIYFVLQLEHHSICYKIKLK